MSFAQPLPHHPLLTDFLIFIIGLLLLAFSYLLLQQFYSPMPLPDTAIVSVPAVTQSAFPISQNSITPVTLKTGVSIGALEQSLGKAFQKAGNEIPANTRLLGIVASNGVVTVNLSREFAQGGGSHSMIGRVEDLQQAVQAVNPSYQMKIQVEGHPLKVLGGEGLELE